MKRWLIGLGALLLTGTLVASVMAGGWRGHRMGPGYRGHMGPGYGHMMGPGYGYGPGYGHHMMGYGPCAWGPGFQGELSSEEAAKLEDLRQSHWTQIQPLREELFNKQQELRSLYAQPNPDKETVDRLEKEAFDLRQKLREKRFAFRRQAEDLAPGYGGPYGFDPGRGRWGGPGPYAGKHCWNY